MISKEEIQEIFRRKKQTILKRGTYVIGDNNQPAAAEAIEDSTNDILMADEAKYYAAVDADKESDGMYMDDETRALYDSIMPNKTENKIQDSINAIIEEQSATDDEQDALVAEIMKKFQNNIQSNVNDLFSSN